MHPFCLVAASLLVRFWVASASVLHRPSCTHPVHSGSWGWIWAGNGVRDGGFRSLPLRCDHYYHDRPIGQGLCL